MRRALLALLLLPGCLKHLDASLLPLPLEPVPPPADAARFDHELLYDGDGWMFIVEPRAAHTERGVHRVIRVLTEAGRSVASQVSVWPGGSELTGIEGRVIAPDGTHSLLDRSQVFWTDEAERGRGLHRLAFQLPNVQVGSVVEFHYVIRLPTMEMEAHRELGETVPVDHYRLDVFVDDGLDYGLRTFFSDAKVETGETAAFHHLSWDLEHLPPRSTIDFSPEELPRWTYRNVGYTMMSGRSVAHVELASGWDGVYRSEMLRLLEPYFYEGLHETLDPSGCSSTACLIRRAWQRVHQLTDTVETGEFWTARPLRDVVAAQQATRHEQVVLFRALLATAGVAADLVFVTRPFGQPLDHKFPTNLHDDVVAFVERRADLPDGMWVDASCEECQPGVLRDVIDNGDAVCISSRPGVYDRPLVVAALATLHGTGRSVKAIDYDVDVTVNENGELQVVENRSGTGAAATEWRQRGQGSNQSIRAGVAERFPQARLLGVRKLACDKRQGRCTLGRDFAVPFGATRTADQLVVPLSAFSASYEEMFAPEQRTVDINVQEGLLFKETLWLKVPPGFKVVEAPQPAEAVGAAFTVKIEVTEQNGALKVVRRVDRTQGRWPASSYPAARAAFRLFASVRDQAVVLGRQ